VHGYAVKLMMPEMMCSLSWPERACERQQYDEALASHMDATHGLQRYGLKVITVHIKDEESQGVLRMLASKLYYVLLHN
jgi:hypothetical protein